MSTYWGYRCISHDPPLESEHWFNHGEDVLIDAYLKVRAGTWPMVPDRLFPGEFEPALVVHRSYETAEPHAWLTDHPRCEVVLANEYGDVRAIGETITSGVAE